MSHHGICYHIYADGTTDHLTEQWANANNFCNEYRKDFKEAVSVAKIASLSCQFPFVVQERPLGGKREKLTNAWAFE